MSRGDSRRGSGGLSAFEAPPRREGGMACRVPAHDTRVGHDVPASGCSPSGPRGGIGGGRPPSAASDQAAEVDYDPVFVNSETGGGVC